jgi:hypothetical protein
MAVACTLVIVVCGPLLRPGTGVCIGIVIHKALDVLQDIKAADGRPSAHRVGLVAYFKSSRVTLPILHRCLHVTLPFAAKR